MSFLAMAVLVLTGAVMAGCTSGELVEEQPESKSKTVTLTTKVGLGASTKALTDDGVKNFAAGETMAVIYNNGTSMVKAVSHELEDVDLIDGGKSATFTFDLETPNVSVDVTYIYPAAMAGETGVDYTRLDSQDGTLVSLSSGLDLATFHGAWEGTSLPAATLENELAILAITLKDNTSPTANDITGTITKLTVSDGTNTYTVTPKAPVTKLSARVYVAIRPTDEANITVTAITDGTKRYSKILTGKTYEKSNGYDVSWRMEAWESNQYKEGTMNWGYNTVTFKKETASNPTPTVVTSSDSNVQWDGGWYTVTGDNVVINGNVTLNGDTHLILCDGAKLTVNGEVYANGDLYIYGQDAGTGILILSSKDYYALTCENLEIHGGNVTVTHTGESYGLSVISDISVYGGNLTVNSSAQYSLLCQSGPIYIYGGSTIVSSTSKAGGSSAICCAGYRYDEGDIIVYGGYLYAGAVYENGRSIYGYVMTEGNVTLYYTNDLSNWGDGVQPSMPVDYCSSRRYAKAE